MSNQLILIKAEHIPNVKVGDMLTMTINPDKSTSLYNSRKVTQIKDNGTLIVECIDKNCTKEDCTYLMLYEHELKTIKIDNTIKESKRLGGITM